MARLASCGFEVQGTSGAATNTEGQGFLVNGSPIVSRQIKRTGRAALECSPGQYARYNITQTLGRSYYAKAHIYIKKFPSSDQTIIAGALGATARMSLKLRASDHKLFLLGTGVSAANGVSAALELNRWYEIDLRFLLDTGSVDQAQGRLDQVSFANVSSLALADSVNDNIQIGLVTATGSGTVIIDDVIINDDQGATANSWPNGGGFHFLLPVADAARDAGWLAGNSSSSNLWDSIDNVPPTPTGTPTVGKDIQNAISTTTQNYDADVQSYTEAGVPAGDTIRMVQALVSFADSSGSTALTCAAQMRSNPGPDAAETTDASSGSGSGQAWPTSRRTIRTPEQWSPTVTRGTRPQMRVGKRTASTNRLEVSLAGVYVEAIPGGGAPVVSRQAMYL